MKCPKCGYTSFDYLMECKKCGEILENCRRALNLKMTEPIIFTNLEEAEPTYTENDDLRIAESLKETEIDQETILLGDFQPPIDDVQVPESTAKELEDFDLELDTLTPLTSETAGGKAEDITFSGFSGNDDGGDGPVVGDAATADAGENLLESNFQPETNTKATATNDGISGLNLDMELPFDFSEPDTPGLQGQGKTGDAATGAGVVELNLDDDESLDKILADLDADNDKQ